MTSKLDYDAENPWTDGHLNGTCEQSTFIEQWRKQMVPMRAPFMSLLTQYFIIFHSQPLVFYFTKNCGS